MTITLTAEDIAAFSDDWNVYAADRNPQGRRDPGAHGLWILPILGIPWLVVILTRSLVGGFVVLWVLACTSRWFVPLVDRFIRGRRMSSRRNLTAPTGIGLSMAGVSVRTDRGRTTYLWSTIPDIVVTDNNILFPVVHRTGRSVVYLPLRSFGDPGQSRRFVELAGQLRQRALTREEAE